MLPKTTLVLGGAASGKSQWAESLILNSGLTPVYLATSRIWDEEMQAKVDLHKARRGGRVADNRRVGRGRGWPAQCNSGAVRVAGLRDHVADQPDDG